MYLPFSLALSLWIQIPSFFGSLNAWSVSWLWPWHLLFCPWQPPPDLPGVGFLPLGLIPNAPGGVSLPLPNPMWRYPSITLSLHPASLAQAMLMLPGADYNVGSKILRKSPSLSQKRGEKGTRLVLLPMVTTISGTDTGLSCSGFCREQLYQSPIRKKKKNPFTCITCCATCVPWTIPFNPWAISPSQRRHWKLRESQEFSWGLTGR